MRRLTNKHADGGGHASEANRSSRVAVLVGWVNQLYELRRQGLIIGSGIVEAANKTHISERLKRSGMRWGIASGQAVPTFCSLVKSVSPWPREKSQVSQCEIHTPNRPITPLRSPIEGGAGEATGIHLEGGFQPHLWMLLGLQGHSRSSRRLVCKW